MHYCMFILGVVMHIQVLSGLAYIFCVRSDQRMVAFATLITSVMGGELKMMFMADQNALVCSLWMEDNSMSEIANMCNLTVDKVSEIIDTYLSLIAGRGAH